MENQIITIDLIINQVREWIENKKVIGPSIWLDAAEKMNVLLGDEHDKLFGLYQKVAIAKRELLEKGSTVASAKVMIEATDDFREMQTQKAKISRIEEFIRLAKIQARLKDNEMRGY